MKIATVAVDSPIDKFFSYLVPSTILSTLRPGVLVVIPFGKRKAKGVVIEVIDSIPERELKEIISLEDEAFALSKEDLIFFEWISKYYHYPVGKLIFDVLPKVLKKPRPLLPIKGAGGELGFELEFDQQGAYEKISAHLLSGHTRWLLHGVTGSGKSAVYIKLMKDVLKEGKSVLFLLPEINLTPQFVSTFIECLGCDVFTYHSEVSDSQKFHLWKELKTRDEPSVVIGVRSSIFLPFKKLGLIVVDEEHDQSYKQDDRCAYHARDLAIKRGDLLQIPVVLGSATPSVESYVQFKKGDSYIPLKKRVGISRLPEITLVNTRQKEDRTETWPLSNESIKRIENALLKNEQVLVFVNRLGFSNYMQCRSCGHQFKCPNCSTSLRYFQKRKELSCYLCEYKESVPHSCPACGNMKLLPKGFGTEKVEKVLRDYFPKKSIERFDRDEIKNIKQLEERLKNFQEGAVDVLVGTQMLSKGHNFKRVNLVVLLGVDAQLNFPDFRASEKIYQQITQVSGRAGRFGPSSEVLIETSMSEHQLFQYIKEHSFDGFYNDEIELRKICLISPFSKSAMIYLTSKINARAESFASEIRHFFNMIKEKHFKSVDVLGPRPAIIEKRVNKFTHVIMLRSTEINELHNMIKTLGQNLKVPSGVTIKLDIDPQQLQ